jgi:hypothetical protein
MIDLSMTWRSGKTKKKDPSGRTRKERIVPRAGNRCRKAGN